MNLEKHTAKIFALNDDNKWLRHANPLSVWTRFVTLPLVVLAFWSRIWIGWLCLIPITITIVWLFINPTIFKEVKHIKSWASKAVMGEKFWIERKKLPIPKYHKIPILILIILQTIGTIILIAGIWQLKVSTTIVGIIIVYFSKMWFLDRMVWIYEDMKRQKGL